MIDVSHYFGIFQSFFQIDQRHCCFPSWTGCCHGFTNVLLWFLEWRNPRVWWRSHCRGSSATVQGGDTHWRTDTERQWGQGGAWCLSHTTTPWITVSRTSSWPRTNGYLHWIRYYQWCIKKKRFISLWYLAKWADGEIFGPFGPECSLALLSFFHWTFHSLLTGSRVGVGF